MSEQDWDEAERVTKKHATGKFGKLENGRSCLGAFVGGPHAVEVHWLNNASVICTGDGCAQCAQRLPTKARVRMNFFDLGEGAMKIWEGGSPFFRDLKILKKKYGLDAMAFEITRQGVGKNTKYTILPDKPLTPEQKARIAAAPLHDLSDPDDEEDEGGDEGGSTATIAPAVRDEFIGRLQALKSEQALFAFLGEFRCERIGDVLASDEQRARRLLESLERKKPDINPFS